MVKEIMSTAKKIAARRANDRQELSHLDSVGLGASGIENADIKDCEKVVFD